MNGVFYNGIRADCGAIHDGDSPYILVIYCEDYSLSDVLKEIVENIYLAHKVCLIKHVVISNQEELDAYNENNKENDNSCNEFTCKSNL